MVNSPNGVISHLGGVLHIPLEELLEDARTADQESRTLQAKVDYMKEHLKIVLSQEKQAAREAAQGRRLSNDEADEIARLTPAYRHALVKKLEVETEYAGALAKSRDLQRTLDWARSGISYIKTELQLG